MLAPTTPLEARPAKSAAAVFARPAQRDPVPAARRLAWPTLTLLTVVFAWCYWPTFLDFVDRWTNLPRYSHGFLVPVFALVVLFARRPKEWPTCEPSAWGLPIMAAAMLVRVLSLWLDSLRRLFVPVAQHDPVLGLSATASRTSLVQTP